MLKPLLSSTTGIVLSDAVQAELQASHLYKHLANQMQRAGYFGAAKYFTKESAEELTHYQKLADYFNDRGSVAKLPDVAALNDTVSDLESAITKAYEIEVDLGNQYAKWYSTIQASDPTTAQFLLQFLEIQRVSIGEYADWLSRISLAKGQPSALLLIDQELGD